MALQYFIKCFFFDTLNCSLATNCGLIPVCQTVWTEFRGPHTHTRLRQPGGDEQKGEGKKNVWEDISRFVIEKKKFFSAIIETFN